MPFQGFVLNNFLSIFKYLPKQFLRNTMNRPCAQARRVKDIGLVLPKYYGESEITAPIRRTRSEIFRVHVGVGAHSLSITCLSFYIIPKNSSTHYECSTSASAPCGAYYLLTGFSERTPDISDVGFCILARPAMTDSSVERAGCASSLANMFFAALTLLLRLLPQSGHLNRILFLSCADASIE